MSDDHTESDETDLIFIWADRFQRFIHHQQTEKVHVTYSDERNEST